MTTSREPWPPKIPTKVIGFYNIQHDILLIRITLIYKTARS
jgi:hypothetical protein